MRTIRWSVCALALAFGLCAARAQTRATWQDEWLARFNRQRERAGVPLFRPSPVLTQVAQHQAEEMAADRRLRPPSGAVIAERLRRVGYSAHDWRESYAIADAAPETRAVLDGRYRDLGVGTAVVDGFPFYIFLFGWHQGDYFAEATAGLGDQARVTAEMLVRVNDFRRRAGLPPLAPNPLLDRVSQAHAEDMLRRSYFGHRSLEGQSPSERAWARGYRSVIGENLVEERFSVKEALDAWLDSPGHRRNILDPGCREMGLGLAIGAGYDAAPGGYRVIWVQSLGRGN